MLRLPGICDLSPWRERLIPAYRTYCQTVSKRSMALSLETCTLLLWLCEGRARRCDLGSGFSSYVLRLDGKATSVDDSIEWLGKTAGFLTAHDLEPSGLVGPDDWDGEYDLILHDFSRGEERNASMWTAAERLAPGGVIVFDDANHDGHRAEMGRVCAAHGLTLTLLPSLTTDATGRFAAIASAEVVVVPTPTLADRYEVARRTPSDIWEHLPTFVEMARGASHVIELGTRSGVSTVAWLHGLEGHGRLTSVDLDPRPDIGDWEHWTFIQGDDLSPEVLGRLEPADIVFLDTSHHYDHTLRELHVYRHLAKHIVLHDTALEHPEGAPRRPRFPVRAAVEEFCRSESLPWTNTDRCFGLAVIDLT